MIVDQGEGEGEGVGAPTAGSASGDELSHYVRFAEQFHGRSLQAPTNGSALTPDNEASWFQGPPVAWPVVIDTMAVPSDGYAVVLARDPAASVVIHSATW